MALLSPQTVYDNLELLDQVDLVRSAAYRQQAVETIANPDVSLNLREAISERLHQANQLLTLRTVSAEDSY